MMIQEFMYLNQPINEDASHPLIDIKLLGHVVWWDSAGTLQANIEMLAFNPPKKKYLHSAPILVITETHVPLTNKSNDINRQ